MLPVVKPSSVPVVKRREARCRGPTRSSPTGTAKFSDAEYPDAVEPRRPRSPERQGLQPRLPEYDYFHDVDYLDYFNRDDYFDYFGYFDYNDYIDYFLSGPKTVVPNPKIPRSNV